MNYLNNYHDMIYDLAYKLRKKGHSIKIFTVRENLYESIKGNYSLDSLRIIPKKLNQSYRNEILLLNNIIVLKEFLYNNKDSDSYDIIHCFDIESSICSKLLKDKYKTKLVFSFCNNIKEEKPGYRRDAKENFLRYLTSWFLQFVDVNLVHTFFNHKKLQDIYLIYESRIKRIPYFGSKKKITNDKSANFNFFLLITFDYEKEIMNTLKFMWYIKQELASALLELITNSDISIFGKLLSKEIRKQGLASIISWSGGMNVKLRELLYKKNSIILFPFSFHNMESFLFESIALNLVIIYQPSQQNEEILLNYKLSYSLDFNNINQDKIKDIISFLTNTPQINNLDNQNKKQMLTNRIKIYENFYKEII
jgi:hypothetical protein